MKKISIIVIFVFILCNILGCSKLVYDISARSNPEFQFPVEELTFIITEIQPSRSNETLIEKNLLKILRVELLQNGWSETSSENATYEFQVTFEMEAGQEYNQTGTYTWYDSKGRAHTGGGIGSTKDVFARQITILAFSNDPEFNDIVWSADCVSLGSTPDVLFPAQYMIPYAIQKFPQSGNWHKKVNPKKK